jgi:hypothetical protein
MNLQDAANLATTLTFLVTFPVVIFGLYQVVELKRTGNLNAFLAVVNYLQDERVRNARGTLIRLSDRDFDSWTKEERDAADLALRRFNSVAIMIRKHLIPIELVLPEWENTLVLCWRSAQPLIAEYRKQRGAQYWHELESLVRLGDRQV